MKLKPCPNPECKSEDLRIDFSVYVRTKMRGGNFRLYWQECLSDTCGAKGPRAKTRAEAERLWNLLPRIGDND